MTRNRVTPRTSHAGPGQRTVLTTVALIAGSLPRGGIKDKAQSERAKRDPRHSDQDAESSAQRFGECHATRSALSDGPAPASKIAQGIGANLSEMLGLVVLCPLLKPSPTSKTT